MAHNLSRLRLYQVTSNCRLRFITGWSVTIFEMCRSRCDSLWVLYVCNGSLFI